MATTCRSWQVWGCSRPRGWVSSLVALLATLLAQFLPLPPRPLQLTGLTQLQRLQLNWVSDDDAAVLPALTSLRHLQLVSCPGVLPDCVSQLIWLRSLHLGSQDWELDFEENEESDLHAATFALWQLQGLTALALTGLDYASYDCLIASALNSLMKLRRVCVCTPERGGLELAPAGLSASHAWLRRVSWLGLDWQVLLANPQLLEAAAALHTLWIMGSCAGGGQHRRAWRTLWRWAGQAPALRRLQLQPSVADFFWSSNLPNPDESVRHGLAALARQRPQLTCSIAAYDDSDDDPKHMWEAFFNG